MDSTINPQAPHFDHANASSREAPAISLSFHRYLPIAAVYFFFNSAGLPTGLFYTTLFAPILYGWLYLKGHRWLTAKFLLILSPFLAAHLIIGVSSVVYYSRS